jgi:hypothetical protein
MVKIKARRQPAQMVVGLMMTTTYSKSDRNSTSKLKVDIRAINENGLQWMVAVVAHGS